MRVGKELKGNRGAGDENGSNMCYIASHKTPHTMFRQPARCGG